MPSPRLIVAAALLVATLAADAAGSAVVQSASSPSAAPAAASFAASAATPDPNHPFGDPIWSPLRNPARVSCVVTNCPGPYHGFDAIDWISEQGDPIYAAGAGIFHIGAIEPGCPTGATTFGTWAWIDHGPAGISRYAHLDSIVASEGQLVTPATQIATMGHSGDQAPCETNYLHMEIRTGDGVESRLPIPSLRACVGGSSVQLPQAMGFPTWDDVPPQVHETPRSDNSCMPSSWPTTPAQPSATAQAGVESISVTPSARSGDVDDVRVRLELFHPSLGDYGATVEQSISPSAQRATFDDLLPGRRYRATVSFHNDAGWSAWSDPVVVDAGVMASAPEFRYLTSTHTTIGYGWYRGANTGADHVVAIRPAEGALWGPWTYHEVASGDLHYRFDGLLRGTKYQVTVRAENEFGAGDWAPRRAITTLGCESVCVTQPQVLTSIRPARIADSRNQPTIDDNHRNTGRRQGGTVWNIPVTGRGGVPVGATAAVINVTLLNSVGAGHATVYPCGDVPTASSVNYGPGSVDPNEVVAKLSPSGSICIFTYATADVIVDVVGYVKDSPYRPLTPTRYADSRDQSTFDGASRATGRRRSGTVWEIPVGGRGAVPASAEAVVVNVTVTQGAEPGFLTVYPCGTRPVASSLNFTAGATRANELVAKLSSSGKLCVYTLSDVDVIVDVVGYLEDVVGFTPLSPARFADSRNQATIDGAHRNTGRRQAGTTWEIPIAGRAGVGAAEAVIANITVTDALGPGFLTVYDCASRPTASTLNYSVGTTRPNETLAKLSTRGSICIYTLASAHILVDVVGYTD